jgi:hypothetical protein
MLGTINPRKAVSRIGIRAEPLAETRSDEHAALFLTRHRGIPVGATGGTLSEPPGNPNRSPRRSQSEPQGIPIGAPGESQSAPPTPPAGDQSSQRLEGGAVRNHRPPTRAAEGGGHAPAKGRHTSHVHAGPAAEGMGSSRETMRARSQQCGPQGEPRPTPPRCRAQAERAAQIRPRWLRRTRAPGGRSRTTPEPCRPVSSTD